MIKTNRVKLNIHYDHIMQDFDIYKVGQNLNGMDKEQRKVVTHGVETLADSLSPALLFYTDMVDTCIPFSIRIV